MSYIEREAVLAEYDRQHKGPPGKARRIIESWPAANVAPIVRCKDCLSYDKAHRLCTLFFHEMYEDDFCSRRAPRL